MERPITYWRTTSATPTSEPRWAIGRWGPRIIAQCEETDARLITQLLNLHELYQEMAGRDKL